MAIYERLDRGGDVFSSENVLDGVAVVTSVFGVSGGVLRSAGLKAINPTTYRAGNWLVMGALAGDAGTFVYASAAAVASMKAIQADPTMDDGQKTSELLRIMASLFVTGAMLIVSNKELLRSGLRPTDFIASKLEPGTKPELDIGTRLDAEYELKRAGQWTTETSKLTDEVLLERVFNQRSRQEIEVELVKKAPKAEVEALTLALGDEGMIDLAKHAGDNLPDIVAEAGAETILDAKTRFGLPATGKLVKAVGGKGLQKVLAKADNVVLLIDPNGSTGSYRWGGTGTLEGALSGMRVNKTVDPKSGLRTLVIDAAEGPIKLNERGRYHDVRVDPAKLSLDDARAFDRLLADFGITDAEVKARVIEAIENARVKNPALSVAGAIKGEVRPVLNEAAAKARSATDAGTPTTAEQVLKGQGMVPIAAEAQGPHIAEAHKHIAAGILDDPEFQAARTLAEGRDVVAQRMIAQTGKTRAESAYRFKGGRIPRARPRRSVRRGPRDSTSPCPSSPRASTRWSRRSGVSLSWASGHKMRAAGCET